VPSNSQQSKRDETAEGELLIDGEDTGPWQALSELVQVARHEQRATVVNDSLNEEGAKLGDRPLAAVLQLWAADSLVYESRFAEAAALLAKMSGRWGKVRFADGEVDVAAIELLGTCYERLGETDAAMATFQQLAQRAPESGAWAYYQAARVAEHAERHDEARKLYLVAAESQDEPSLNSWPVPELARRAAARLETKDCQRFPGPLKLARQLARALEQADRNALFALASPTHFSMGIAGAHAVFVDPTPVVELLVDSASASRLAVDVTNLLGGGQKRYLLTAGWSANELNGTIAFLLVETNFGWEWAGIAPFTPPKSIIDALEPTTRETNQPLTMPIKAPWPIGQSFSAGGLSQFILTQIFAAFTIPALSWLDVGFGPRGFYYNEGSTHQGDDAFAIDFTRYARGQPYHNISGSSAVLACQLGVVTLARGTIASGDPAMDNRVEIRHARVVMPVGSRLPALLAEPFVSKSLHFQGPGRVPVSRFMFVRQGARLGVMDDTGNSLFDHLHFSIHADFRGGRTVRPTPMDGHELNDWNYGATVRSSNVPFP